MSLNFFPASVWAETTVRRTRESCTFSPEPSSTSHLMNHRTWTWQTLTTWNTVVLGSDAPRLYLMQVRRRSQLPPGGRLEKKKNTLCLFWMMPSLIVCDGSQRGRQSGAQNHNTFAVTSGFFFFFHTREERRIRGLHTQVDELSDRSCFQIFWGKFMSSPLNIFPPPLS